MAYPGNPELSLQAQERVMTAFRQVVTKLQEGQREEAQIGLEFVLRLDPAFAPAINLRQQLSSGAEEIDLSDIIAQLQAPTTDAINELLVEAVEDFNQRNFIEAKEKVEKVLIELPGHQEARELLRQVEDALKVENQVGQFLAQAREALNQGDPQEAANFVMMAQALDPHHGGIASTLEEIHARGGVQPSPAAEPPAAPEIPAAPEAPAALEAPVAPEAAVAPAAPPSPESTVSFDSPTGQDGEFGVRFDEAAPAPEFAPFGDAAAPTAADALVDRPPDEAAVTSDLSVSADHPAAPAAGEPPPAAEAGPVDQPPAAEEPRPEDDVAGLFEAEPADLEVPPADDVSDLFEAEPAGEAPLPTTVAAAADDGADAVEELMARGTRAFDSGDFLSAIDAWSRVWLVDPTNSHVAQRIAEAKGHQAEIDSQVGQLLFEAQDANLSGEDARALELVQQILSLHPTHIEAFALRARLAPADETAPPGTAADDAGPEMPDLEDDLFDEELAGAAELDDGEVAMLADDAGEVVAKRRLPEISVQLLALVAVGVLAVVVAVWLGFRMLGGGDDGASGDVYEIAAQAEETLNAGKAQQALDLLDRYQPKNDIEQRVVDRVRQKCLAALATPTPTPLPPQLVSARHFMERGQWFRAYAEAMAGLDSFPADIALGEIADEVKNIEPMASTLRVALKNGNHQSAAGIAHDLMLRYPGQGDLREVLERSLFNSALAELRAYNLTGAEGYLRELADLRPDDDEVIRVLDFINNYKARPVDLQLKMFIRSLHERVKWAAPTPGPAMPTPTPGPPTTAGGPDAAAPAELPPADETSRMLARAQALLETYEALGGAYDESIAELYADDAIIEMARLKPSGEMERMRISGIDHKKLVPEIMAGARERGEEHSFSNVQLSVEGTRVRINCSRRSSVTGSETPHTMVVGPDANGEWLILEEIIESPPSS
jgi:tetratricopeptide (TPR) repeat protein